MEGYTRMGKSCETGWEAHIESLQMAKHFVVSWANLVAQDEGMSGGEKKDEGEQLKRKMDTCVAMEAYGRASLKAHQVMRQQLRDNLSIIDLEQTSAETLEELASSDMSQLFTRTVDNSLYRDQPTDKKVETLERLVSAMADDDLVVTQSTLDVNTTCPITGNEMVNPVRSTLCSHSYSREGIYAHIATMQKSREQALCPVSGCDQPVRKNALQRDVDMEIVLRQKKRLHANTAPEDEEVEDVE